MLDLIRQLLTPSSSGVSDEKIYEQHCAEFRALNTIFWQIPLLVMTLNGGLWFAVASLDLTESGQRLILLFAAAVNIGFVFALIRLRLIMDALLSRIRKFEGRHQARAPFAWVVISVFIALMVIATIGASVVAANPRGFLETKRSSVTVVVCPSAGAAGSPSPPDCRTFVSR